MFTFSSVFVILLLILTKLMPLTYCDNQIPCESKNSWYQNEFSCCFNETQINDFEFCTFGYFGEENFNQDLFFSENSIDCLVENPNEYYFSNSSEANCTDLPNLVSQNYLCWSHYKKDWQWKCYDNKNFAELNYTIETTNDVLDGSVVAMDEDSKFELKLRIFEGVPEPIYKLNDIYVEKNDSVDNEIIINYVFWYTDIPTSCGHPYPFELFIKQAGFECQSDGTSSKKCRRFSFYLEDVRNCMSKKVTIILAILIPTCLLISLTICLWYCYRKRIFPFTNGCCDKRKTRENHTIITLSKSQLRPNNHQQSHINNHYASVTPSNDYVIDDSRFTEIDLNESESHHQQRPNLTPMTSYIETVTARYDVSLLDNAPN